MSVLPPKADIDPGAKENWPVDGSGRSAGGARPGPGKSQPQQRSFSLFAFVRTGYDAVVCSLRVHDLIRVILHGARDLLDAIKLFGARG
jgi:hypothetical protein